MERAGRWTLAGVILVGGLGSCMDATDVELLQIPDAGVVFGQAFLDVNGSGAIDTGDSPLVGTAVLLTAPGTGTTMQQATTDANGLFLFEDVPLGTYSLTIEAGVLGDSLTTFSAAATFNVEFGDTLQLNLGATYPILTLSEVRAAVPGRRVFTHGVALNARESNGDGVVHLREGAAFLRATGVDPLTISPGDSVRMLGRTAVDGGQPVLSQVTAGVLRQNAVFIAPQLVTIATADAANGGALDAALVRLGPAEIGDTATIGGQLQFWAHNGADSVQVVLRDYLLISPNPPIRPDTIVRMIQATGLLRPYMDASGPRWRLLPRGTADLQTETKRADVSVTTSFSTTDATAGETVEIMVTARNSPGATHTATGVAVSDTVPAGLTYLSATATQGSYDPATHLWTVGNLAAGAAADTLRIRVEITGGPGTVANRAHSGGLVLEVETNESNDSATTTPNLTIS